MSIGKLALKEEILRKVLVELDILDYSPIKGCYFVLPYGRFLLDQIHNKIIKNLDHQKIISPTLINKDIFNLEPVPTDITSETFTINQKSYLLKPTSEMLLYPFLKNKALSSKYLPIKIYCQNSVFRRENSTNIGIRSQEIFGFLEHHALHINHQQNLKNIQEIKKVYIDMFKSLNIPIKLLTRTEDDRFPGANKTIAFDTIIENHRLQLGTIHDLGTNFSIPLSIKYKTTQNSYAYPYINCAGISERVLYSLIYFNYDFEDKILKLPKDILLENIIVNKKIFCAEDLIKISKIKGIKYCNTFNYAINKEDIKSLIRKGYRYTLRKNKEQNFILVDNYLKKDLIIQNLFDIEDSMIVENSNINILDIVELELENVFDFDHDFPFKVRYNNNDHNSVIEVMLEILQNEKIKTSIYGYDSEFIYLGRTY